MNKEIATLAGGCFWCTEAIFSRLKGVTKVTPGYAGGKVENPSYEQVSLGNTGHAEAIQIEFDPREISFATILKVFWYTHNPTTINQQGNDFGPQYRSVIFYHDNVQKEVAEKSKIALAKEENYHNPIVTEVVPFTNYYEAEDYHKAYYENHSAAAYCTAVIGPKVHKLLEKYAAKIKPEYVNI